MCVLQALQGVAEVNADIMSHLHSALICTVVYFLRHRHCGVGDGNGWRNGCDLAVAVMVVAIVALTGGVVVEMVVIVVDVVVVVVVGIEDVVLVVMRL